MIPNRSTDLDQSMGLFHPIFDDDSRDRKSQAVSFRMINSISGARVLCQIGLFFEMS
jgi:hypothetical protein